MSAPAKITYTSASGDLGRVPSPLRRGARRRCAARPARATPSTSAARRSRAGWSPLVDRSPIDTSFVLGTFACAGAADVDRAVASARAAQRGWARLPWRERLAILRRAAALIRERKYELAAIMAWRWARAGSRRWATPRRAPT